MTDERLLRLERLSEVLRALTKAGELDSFLQTVISAAGELTDSDSASILEFDEQSQTLRFLAAPPAQREALRSIGVPVGASVAGWAFQEQKPLRVPDVKADARHFSVVDFILGYQTRSLLAVPLIVNGKALGVLEAVNKRETDYTEEDVTILETLAACAAPAIQNSYLQHRIEASFSELSELDRLKNDFIAITSHELRTPLGVILGHATFLRELLDEQYGEQVEVIIKNAARLKEIVESLASMENYNTGEAILRQRAISITRLVKDVIASFKDNAAKRNITLEAESGPDELFVEADETKISIALSNLVKNAVTFTDSGGRVVVKSELIPGHVKISVIDNGIGIPMKDLPRIFDRFFQVESHLTRRHNGMGLGLSVAKAMVEMHGGRIWAESVDGQGSNFCFLLPVKAVRTAAAPQAFLT